MKQGTPLIAHFGALAAFALAIPAAHATTIFSHTFNEGTGGLDGTAVDTGTGSWVAANVVTANGVFATNPGSATLAFSPSNGFEYILDARILNVTGNGNWVALGFANGQNTANDANDRFITGDVVGTAWSLFRGDNDPNANASHLGTGVLGAGNGGLGGENWSVLNFQDGTYTGDPLPPPPPPPEPPVPLVSLIPVTDGDPSTDENPDTRRTTATFTCGPLMAARPGSVPTAAPSACPPSTTPLSWISAPPTCRKSSRTCPRGTAS